MGSQLSAWPSALIGRRPGSSDSGWEGAAAGLGGAVTGCQSEDGRIGKADTGPGPRRRRRASFFYAGRGCQGLQVLSIH
jgi:hypothetical protein